MGNNEKHTLRTHYGRAGNTLSPLGATPRRKNARVQLPVAKTDNYAQRPAGPTDKRNNAYADVGATPMDFRL
eukprot:11160724-Lingulodinium_polyedra.AAC.1